MKKYSIPVALLLSFGVLAQEAKRPDNWFNLDPTTNNINGVSTERAYKELLNNKKSTTIIVGVLDSGVDYMHEDLKDVMWTNPGEIANNGIDDDKNGYIDDIHGWNFIGGKDGQNVEKDNLELVRVYKALKPKYDGKAEKDFTSKVEKEECKKYLAAKADYESQKTTAEAQLNQYSFIKTGLEDLVAKVKQSQGIDKVTLDALKKYEATEQKEKQMLAIAKTTLASYPEDATTDELIEQLNEGVNHFKDQLESNLNVDFDPRGIVGDNYNDSQERFYGNADCKGPFSFHGTHVAGIIAAKRSNNIGMDGVADNVRIMSVRCVPNGDERDKDVANAIRYAVDNGAKIINMSFGKKYSWDKKVVDDAVKYAESKGVLLIHAAGNEALNIDEVAHYPCKKFENSRKIAPNFMDIGALSWKANEKLVASFSNYGKKTVDVFSPGVEIYSCAPESKYKDASGTSMAAPVTAGVAAVLKSYYPQLTPKQLKKILMKSAKTTYKKTKIIKPGSKDKLIEFKQLSKTGGMVNLYEALKLAEKYN